MVEVDCPLEVVVPREAAGYQDWYLAVEVDCPRAVVPPEAAGYQGWCLAVEMYCHRAAADPLEAYFQGVTLQASPGLLG